MRNRDCANQTGPRAWTLAAALGMVAFAAVLPLRLAAQIKTTTVQGTVYRADGTPASGTLLISWPAFTTPQNQAIAAGSTSTAIGSDGFVSINLTPNAGSLPEGNYYTAVYHLSDGTVTPEYWVVPSSGSAAIASVRAQLQPSTVAVQPVSQAYVAGAIASLSGSWLPLGGGALTGPLTLSSDPTASSQAATKHYADQMAAAQLPLAGGTLTGPLTVPNLSTKQFEGRLYADQQQSGSGSNNGIAMSIADCLSYAYACEVLAPSVYAQTEGQPWGGFLSPAVAPQNQGPKSTDPLGCFTDDRWAAPQVICNEGMPDTSGRFNMAPWGIAENALTMGQALNPHNVAAQILSAQWMGARDFPMGLGTDESTVAGLVVNTNVFSPANNDGITIHANSWSPADVVADDVFAYGMGTTLGQNEGPEIRYRIGEPGNVSQVTLTTAPACGVTCTMKGTQTLGTSGAFGEELPWIDLNRGYSSGYIASIAGTAVTGNATNWDTTYGTSNAVTTTTANIKNPGSTNSFPQTNVTIGVASSAGFTTGTAYAFAAGSNKWQGFHITSIPDGTHIVVDEVYYPMASGSTVSQGGLAGYGLKMDADDVCANNYNGMGGGADSPVITGACIHSVYPVVSNAAGNVLTVYGGDPATLGFGPTGTRAYLAMSGSGGSASVTVSGGVVTACTATGGSGYQSATNVGMFVDPPQLVISGITSTTAPVIYVSGTGSGGSLNGCTVANAGAGISGTPTVAVVTSNPYHIYPQAESVQNYNATTGKMDASALVTMPWAGTVSAGDVVEQEHYFAYKMSGAARNAVVNGWQLDGGKLADTILCSGGWTNNDYCGTTYTNAQDPTLYQGSPIATPYVIGRGQMLTPYGVVLNGAFRNGLTLGLPPFSNQPRNGAVVVNCGSWCSAWSRSYNVLSVQNANNNNTAEDVLQYNPASQSWTWTAGATGTVGSNPACTVNLAGSSSPGLSVTCNGAVSRFDGSGNLTVAGAFHAQGAVTGAIINGEVTVDGTTYTTLNAAWSAALALAGSTGHNQTVRLGPGTFPVTATLNEPSNGACVSLLGSGGTTVNADSPQVASTLTLSASLGGDVIYLGNTSQAQGCTFKDLNFLASGYATHGFELQWFRGALIDNVTVNDTTAEGILLGEENTASGHQANFLLHNVTVSYSSAAFTPANRPAYGIHLGKTAIDSQLDNITVRYALTS
ncbi:MAG TPA: hypothetical protein VFE06_18170, partial [Acidobacteriaceae bacterium]|nr:hypothetical protein [Acidobacteriaceae bacterium]